MSGPLSPPARHFADSVDRLQNNLAIVHKRLGEYDEAVALLEETLSLKRALNDHLGLPASLANLGNLLVPQGNPSSAAVHYRDALVQRQAMQDRAGMLSSINQIASLGVAVGRFGQAVVLYAAADALRQAMLIVRTADIEADHQKDMALIHDQLSPADFGSHGRLVLAAIQKTVAGLQARETIMAQLTQMGRLHANFGIPYHYYFVFRVQGGEILYDSNQSLGNDFNESVETADPDLAAIIQREQNMLDFESMAGLTMGNLWDEFVLRRPVEELYITIILKA